MTDQTLMASEQMPKAMALVLCGMFARSNMGLEPPASEAVSWAKTAGVTSDRGLGRVLLPGVLDSDADQAMFGAQAEAPFEQLGGLTLVAQRETWPDILELYERG